MRPLHVPPKVKILTAYLDITKDMTQTDYCCSTKLLAAANWVFGIAENDKSIVFRYAVFLTQENMDIKNYVIFRAQRVEGVS